MLKEIEKQTDFRFMYSNTVIENSKSVTISFDKEPLPAALKLCFTNQPINYEIDGKLIVLKMADSATATANHELRGRILNDRGEALANATVKIKGVAASVITDENGLFLISYHHSNDTLVVSGAELPEQETLIAGRSFIEVIMISQVGVLDETIVKGYYKTSRKLNIGTVDKVSAKTIGDQAVSNPLAALQGRVPGLLITQSNGLPGSNFSVLLRGQNSLQRGTEPLFVVDGVPFNTERQTQRSVVAANNPFNMINPLDIQSIEVLKDAEATAIYGSRGANGVILITTKKAESGKTRVEINVSAGFARAQNMPEFMTTTEYLAVRREAFSNDGITPTTANAPDLLIWDTTRYTDWKKVLVGGTARTERVYTKLSGGSSQTSYSFAASYYKETTVFPGDAGDRRISFNLNLLHRSLDRKLTVEASSMYSFANGLLGQGDLTSAIGLAPNAPALYDSVGRLNWHERNASFNNPLATLFRRFESKTDWMNTNFSIAYRLSEALSAKVSGGYNMQLLNELSLVPIAAQNPAINPRGNSAFGNSSNKNWIIEPQIEYKTILPGSIRITSQVGGSYQTKETTTSLIAARGYTSDALIRSAAGAATTEATTGFLEYKYVGVFGRLTLNRKDRYLFSFTGRRDGSSRFGENNRFSTFAAGAVGWVFSEESFISNNVPVLSYGKIRASYGTSGNDQIGEYMYLDTWSPTSNPYNGSTALRPTRLQNTGYRWELKKNLEFGMETGFFENRVLLNAAYFRSVSNDQLLNYNLPGQTGFTSILLNFPAVIQNTGGEFSILVKALNKRSVKWETSINLTVQRNKLLEFPQLEASSYATNYQIGRPISLFRGYAFNGIDNNTGIYQFKDLNNDGLITGEDQYFVTSLNPSFFGGMHHDFSFKNFELGIFLNFVKQQGIDILSGILAGNGENIPVELHDRWTKPGDHAAYQRYSTQPAVWTAATRMPASDATIVDASYIKLRSLNFAYRMPERFLRKMHISYCKLFIQGQNLLTFTGYKGGDPETQRLTSLPPLRVFNFGISATF